MSLPNEPIAYVDAPSGKQAKVSIITVNYNNAAGLRQTLESVKLQEYRDIEYIIIDGGSTDDSVAIIKEFSEIITYWVSEKDKGVYNAMNKGIEKATGEYCYFLNSGDFLWKSDVLSRIFSADIHDGIVYGNMIHGGIETEEKSHADLSFYDFFTGSIYHQAAFIRRDIFDKVGLYEETYKVVADWVWFVKAIFLHGCSTRYVDVAVALYETGGLSFQDLDGNLRDRRTVIERYFPRFVKDYDEYHRIRQSEFIGLLWVMEHNKLVNRVLKSFMSFTRFIRFSVLRKDRGPRKAF